MKIEKVNTEDKKPSERTYLGYKVYLRRIAYVSDIPVDYIGDVAQDAFVLCARYKHFLGTPEESRRALLIRILKSWCMDLYRKMKCRSYGELNGEAYNSEDYPVYDKVANLLDSVANKEGCQASFKEIGGMPENWCQVVTLRLIEGRPTREVYAMLNITEKACYSRVSRIEKYLEELPKNDDWS